MNVLHSSAKTGGKDDWQTPEIVLECVRKLGPIALDPCTTEANPTGARRWIHPGSAEDGLTGHWCAAGLVFVNPPFSTLRRWMLKCQVEAHRGCEIILLCPARTDTRAWHEVRPDRTAFWRGRLCYNDPTTGKPKQYTSKTGRVSDEPATFATALLYWGPRARTFAKVFGAVAQIVIPDWAETPPLTQKELKNLRAGRTIKS